MFVNMFFFNFFYLSSRGSTLNKKTETLFFLSPKFYFPQYRTYMHQNANWTIITNLMWDVDLLTKCFHVTYESSGQSDDEAY